VLRTLLTVAFISFLPPLAVCQAPAFEAASVKPGTPVQMPAGSRVKSTGARRSEDPGRITYQNTTLLDVLMRAYDVKRRQISGPAWLDNETYDIVATFPTGASKEQIPAMLQNLLAERFKMTVRVESRPERVYALTAGKNPRLKKSEDTESTRVDFDAKGHTEFIGYTLPAFTGALTNLLDRSVVDSTGLTGRFDISTHLELALPAPPGSASADASDPAPSIFTAMQELGLKLEAKEGSVKYIVIDKADRVPTAN
jgi:uncharacterized protein (TIGR03435 family)